MKPDQEKGFKCYVDSDFLGGWNQEDGREPGSLLSRTGYVFTYDNCPIIWAGQLQTEITLRTIEVGYIALSQTMRGVLPFVSLMKKIEFVLKLQRDTLAVLCSLFGNPFTVYKYNQGAITLGVYPQMRPHTNHITIKSHHFCFFH